MSGKFSSAIGGFARNALGRRALFRRIAGGGALVGAAMGGLKPGIALADVGPATELDSSGLRLANIGICVADLDKSTVFYQALGFEAGDVHQIGGPLGHALEVGDDSKLEIRFVKRDGVVLELIHFINPAAKGKAGRRPMNQLGLTHLALRVDDVDRVAAIVKKNGGALVETSRTKLGPPGKGIDILFVTDPNGVRIELAGLVKA